jgi:hypothetical protein
MKRLLPILIGSLCAATALATTYVRVEKDGSKTYSDRPIPGGVPVELAPAQTYASPGTTSSGNSNVPAEQRLVEQQTEDFRYLSCEISPKHDSTFQNPEQVSISVNLNPSLRAVDTAVVTVDGTPIPGANSTAMVMTSVNRGSHTVSAVVKDRFGKILCRATATFHVFKPSVNLPARRN